MRGKKAFGQCLRCSLKNEDIFMHSFCAAILNTSTSWLQDSTNFITLQGHHYKTGSTLEAMYWAKNISVERKLRNAEVRGPNPRM